MTLVRWAYHSSEHLLICVVNASGFENASDSDSSDSSRGKMKLEKISDDDLSDIKSSVS